MGRVFGPFGAAARLGVPASTLESKSEAPAPSAQDRRQISLGELVGSKFLEPFGLAMGQRKEGFALFDLRPGGGCCQRRRLKNGWATLCTAASAEWHAEATLS